MKREWKHLAAPLLCAAGGFVLFLAMDRWAGGEETVEKSGQIVRESYGGEERRHRLLVEGLGEKAVAVEVEVSPRTYTKDQAFRVFDHMMEQMEERIRGDNPSLMEISENLQLPSWWEETGVRLRWSSSEPELLDGSGRVLPVEKETEAKLVVQMTAGEYQAEFSLPVCLVPRPLSEGEARVANFQQFLEKRNQEEEHQPYLQLPKEYQGNLLHYKSVQSKDYALLPFLGALMGGLLYSRRGAKEKKRQKERERELLLDYADLVSKLMILTGAGMTVRNAWGRMVRDYEEEQEGGRRRMRAAYEEMKKTWEQMEGGIPEGQAICGFGRRCGLAPYLKLSSLLEQNRKAGNKNLRLLLYNEAEDALEQRKNLARRLGEEAGTKLLAPLLLVLGIVMVMVMMPAMMTMK